MEHTPDKILIYSCIMLLSVFISSISQLLLKKSAQKKYGSRIKEYLNPLVICGYFLLFLCTFITMFALKVIPLSMGAIIESAGYIFVAVLSYIFFKEKLTKKQLLGIALIIIGIIIFSL